VATSKAQRYVLKNARIIVSPEKTIEKGTLIIEGDRIVDVGALIFSTGDAVEIDCDGLTIVPAFVELWTSIGLPKPVSGEYSPFRPQLNSSKKGAYYWNESIHPEVNAAGSYSPDAKAITDLHKMGVGFALTQIPDGIAQGTGTFVSLSPAKVHQHLLHLREVGHCPDHLRRAIDHQLTLAQQSRGQQTARLLDQAAAT
jgi:imidazolonepropionase-like amidohydrolase